MEEDKTVRTQDKSPEDRQTGQDDIYAYTIEDATFGELKVLATANGWWADKQKVLDLLRAYKIDANDDEACAHAGIPQRNLQYFKELHPEFSYVKYACQQLLGLQSKQNIASEIQKEAKEGGTGRSSWYLERKRKDEYSMRSEITGAEGRELYEGVSNRLEQITADVEKHLANKAKSDKDIDANKGGSGDDATPASDRAGE